MKKRIFSILLCLMLAVSLLPITALAADVTYTVYVGGVEMTYSTQTDTPVYYKNGASEATTTEPNDGWNARLTYDSTNGLILTIKDLVTAGGANDAATDGAGIFSDMDELSLVLEGTSTVAGAQSYGIRANGDLTVSGSGELKVSSKTVGIGVIDGGGFKVNSGTVRAAGGTTGVICTGADGITIEGGTLTAEGETYGLFSKNSVTVNGGKVVAAADKEGTGTHTGIHSQDGVVTISGGTVIAEGAKFAMNKSPVISYANGYQWTTAEGGDMTKSTDAAYTYSDTHTYLKVEPLVLTYTIILDANGGDPDWIISDIAHGSTANEAFNEQVGSVGLDAGEEFVSSRSGYTFDGWYTGEDEGTTPAEKYDFDSEVTGDITLYAKWIPDAVEEEPCAKDETCPMYGYTDLDMDEWYHDGIHFCIENGLMQGMGDGKFDPGLDINRAMIVTMLWRLEGSPVVNYDMTFEDVDDGMWYTEAVRWAAAGGMVNGYSAEAFGPNDTLTREQMVTMLWRCCRNKGIDVSAGESTNILSFEDAAEISDWAYPAMQWACGEGLIRGIGGNLLDPQGSATRAHAAAVIQRFCETVRS